MLSCDIVKDLLPLYVDGICSEESKREIEEHLKDCESCSKELEMLANFEDIGDDVDEEAAFRKFNNKIGKPIWPVLMHLRMVD